MTDSTNIPTENVQTFIDALKKEGVTTFNYPIWKEKFLSVLAGIDTQIFTVADERRDKKQAIIARVQELREQGMTESNPGFDVALQMLEIMPSFEKEIHLRGVEITVAMTMFAVSTNIIETMRGLGISENIVKEQQKFLSDEWERMQSVFTKYIGEVMSNHKEQTSVQISNANELNKKLLEHIDNRDNTIKDMISKGIVTKDALKEMITQNTSKHVYEQQQPTQEQQQRFNQALHDMNIRKVQVQPEQQQSQQQQTTNDNTVIKKERIPDPPIPQQEQRNIPKPVTATDIYNIQKKVIDDNTNTIKKKPSRDVNMNKNNEVDRDAEPFSNVDTHSEIHNDNEEETQKQETVIEKKEQTITQENKPIKDLKVSDYDVNAFIERVKPTLDTKNNIKQVKESRMYYRWTFKKKFNTKTVPDALEKIFTDKLNELEQSNV